MAAKTVLSVGQCGFDHAAISRLVGTVGGRAVKVDLHSDIEAAIDAHRPALILINRINDSDGSSGIACIKQLKAKFPQIPVMLVSNLADAQSEAVVSGAVPGFGKSAIGSDGTAELLARYLTQDTP